MTLLIDHAEFEVLHVADGEDISELSFCHPGLPFLPAFLASIIEANRLSTDRLTRDYQLRLLESGTLKAVSPFTGTEIQIINSYMFGEQMVFYRFRDVRPVFMIVSDLGAGFPVTAVVLPKDRVLVRLGTSVWGPQSEHLEKLTATLHHPPEVQGSTPARIAVTGDHNFAHHAWNQLGGIQAIIDNGLLGQVDKIVVTSEPLGRLDEIFPEIAGKALCRIPYRDIDNLRTPNALFIMPAGTLLANGVRDRVLQFATRKLSPTGISWLQSVASLKANGCAPLFWISVRTRNRTATNQVSLLAAVIEGLARSFERCGFILDGHSLPMDEQTNPDVYSDQIERIVSDDKEVIRQLKQLMIDRNIYRKNLIEAVGLPVLDSIYLGQFAEFYVCHHGTVQHKIGWFHRKPGVVHANSSFLRDSTAAWVAAQSEHAIEPAYLKPEWVVDLEPVDDSGLYGMHRQNYLVRDVGAAAQFVVEQARLALDATAVIRGPN